MNYFIINQIKFEFVEIKIAKSILACQKKKNITTLICL